MIEGFSSLASPGHARMHIDACSPDSNRRASLVRLLLEGFSSLDAAPAAIGHGLVLTAAEFRVSAFVVDGVTSMPTGSNPTSLAPDPLTVC
jgi:hypothetical protein